MEPLILPKIIVILRNEESPREERAIEKVASSS